jgi:uncharacterized membrane protein
MNGTLWTLQGLLALIFLVTGAVKIVLPKERLVTYMGWVENVSQSAVRLVGVVEILGAMGLILPSLTGIMPWLTPLAAAGLTLTMVGASLTHYRRSEFSRIGMTTVLLLMALFVAIGRAWIMPL